MSEFLGFDPLKRRKPTSFSRVSITEAKKRLRESIKILVDTERRLGLLNASDFHDSDQLQEWFSTEIGKVKKLIEG